MAASLKKRAEQEQAARERAADGPLLARAEARVADRLARSAQREGPRAAAA